MSGRQGSGRLAEAASRSAVDPATPRTGPAPTSRTPRARQTRAALLAAARRLFARRAFEQVSLREIGAAARADPALIARYFSSKEGLFAEALAASHVSDSLFPGDPAGFAQRATRAAVLGEWQSSGFEGLLIAMRSASSPLVSGAHIRPFEQRFVHGLADQIGGDEPVARAHLVFACIVGTALLHGMRSPEAATYSPDQAPVIAARFKLELERMVNRTA